MKKTISSLFIIFLFAVSLYAQPVVIPEMEFSNAEITDILVALSSATGKSIIPDETVRGNATYAFRDKMDFDTAFRIFLDTYKLYYRVENGIYYVSRIQVTTNTEKGTISLDAEDVDLVLLIRSASKALNVTVIDESLPSGRLTIHAKNMKPEDFFKMLLDKYPGYSLEKREGYFLVKRVPVDTSGVSTVPGISVTNGLYNLNVKKIRFKDLLTGLFQRSGFEYSNLSRKDQILEDLKFTGRTFDELLSLVCEQMSMDFQKSDGVYYIFEISQRDVLKKLKITELINLKYITTQDFQRLLPSDLSSSNLYKLDPAQNVIILNGSIDEISPLRDFIKIIDKETSSDKFYLFTLNFIDVKNIKTVLPESFKYNLPVVVPGSNAFLMQLSDEKKKLLDEFLKTADTRPDARYVKLKYIQTEDLLKALPPTVGKENLLPTSETNSVFFLGSDEKYNAFMQDLKLIDQPVPQIKYKILVIQYEKTNNVDFGINTDTVISEDETKFGTGDGQMMKGYAFSGAFSEIANLSFDIIDQFGIGFALSLNASLVQKNARVFADTTLTGISGQEIKFQNTETSRYREVSTSTSTTDTSTFVTSEISSGLIISIKGWVSGNGMITMSVGATVSKQSAGDSENQLPSTSEKVVNTQVRTQSGEPVVIGGLIYQNLEENISKVPVLGDIPLLGLLFQSINEKYTNSEMVIYIVPVIAIDADDQYISSQNMDRIYKKHILPLRTNYFE